MEHFYTTEVYPTRTENGHKWCVTILRDGILHESWQFFYTKREADIQAQRAAVMWNQ